MTPEESKQLNKYLDKQLTAILTHGIKKYTPDSIDLPDIEELVQAVIKNSQNEINGIKFEIENLIIDELDNILEEEKGSLIR